MRSTNRGNGYRRKAVLARWMRMPAPNWGVLGEKTNGQMQVEIKDAKTNAFINQVDFP